MHRSMAGLVAAVALAVGCASWSGARLYAEGNRALAQGDAAGAIEAFERAAQHVPHASEIQNHLGIAYLEAGREEEARAAFRRAVALDCDNRAAEANLRALEPDVSP